MMRTNEKLHENPKLYGFGKFLGEKVVEWSAPRYLKSVRYCVEQEFQLAQICLCWPVEPLYAP